MNDSNQREIELYVYHVITQVPHVKRPFVFEVYTYTKLFSLPYIRKLMSPFFDCDFTIVDFSRKTVHVPENQINKFKII